MQKHISLLSELFVTVGTFVRFHTRMCQHMLIQITLVDELFVTVGTVVRFLSSVDLNMAIEIVFAGEGLRAKYAIQLSYAFLIFPPPSCNLCSFVRLFMHFFLTGTDFVSMNLN